MSIRDIELTLIDGTKTTFGALGKGPVLVVNVASRCGLTPQYEALEELQKKYGPRGFTVVGLPSDQFKQELATNEDVAPNKWVYNQEFYLILNLAMGGHFTGPIADDLQSAQLTVDWIRFYSVGGVGELILH